MIFFGFAFVGKSLFPVAGFELIGDDEMTPPIHLPSRVAFGTYYYENAYVCIMAYNFKKFQHFSF